MEKVKLTNMCMIINEETKQVLVQDRVKSWQGITFPGGKLKEGEAIIPSTIREIKEETGLTISNLKFCGIKDWYDYQKEERYIVFLLKTSTFTGTLINETDEGKVFWVDIDKIKDYKLSPDFSEMLAIYQGQYAEFFYEDLQTEDEDEEGNSRWVKKLF